MTWSSAPLEDLCDITVGRTPARATPEYWGPGEPWLSIADMSQGRRITRTKEQITTAGASGGKQVLPGTVLLSFKLSIGRVAITDVPLFTNEAIAALPIKRPDLVDANYLARALEALDLSSGSNRAAMGATLNKAALRRIRVPLPPLDEQRRIAAILDRADDLRMKRFESLALLDGLAKSVFGDLFESETFPTYPLASLADVASGITKGRKLREEATRAVPYLAVSNVQAGHLKMAIVKEIDATEAEIRRFALKDGDLVLTEGGDPDKLGRGTVWRSQLPVCIHQNHIFRVRIAPGAKLLPDFLSAYMSSPPARAYFLRAAKQTTGIASINMTQLKGLPVSVPELALQEEFVARVDAIGRHAASVNGASRCESRLFRSLESRAFSGRL